MQAPLEHPTHSRLSALALLIPALFAPSAPAQEAPLLFERDVRPLLARHCFSCHGEGKRRAGLDLRTVTTMLRGGDTGPALVPGETQGTLLLDLTAKKEMPPGDKPKLSDAEIDLLRRWVRQGAPAQEKVSHALVSDRDRQHWAFQKLGQHQPPLVKGTNRVRTPIDAFVLARLEGKNLRFAPDARRVTLLRRLHHDLVGLPPSPEELQSFLADTAPGAYDRAVDRLLTSPHFGERWGRHWLDGAGYVDVTGTDNDASIIKLGPSKWLYRDWVVRAFNEDKPFDRFLTEQLAGDELIDWRSAKKFTPEIRDLLIATGFLRVAADDTNENELNTLDIRHHVLQQTGEIVAGNLLALTVGCARCHNHKYDPIPQRDYYRLLAVLTPALNPDNWRQPQQRQMPDVSAVEKAEIDRYNADLTRRIGELKKRETELLRAGTERVFQARLASIPEPIRADTRQAVQTPAAKRNEVQRYLAQRLGPRLAVSPGEAVAALTDTEKSAMEEAKRGPSELEQQRRQTGTLHVLYDVGAPTPTRVLYRGEHDRPTYAVRPGLPAVIAPSDEAALLEPGKPAGASSGRRLALARRLTNPESRAGALVARVRVNRIWQQLFGRGIVATSDNFGRAGAKPTHPELLDWLASSFARKGWRTKPLIRMLVTSTVYRQGSRSKEGQSTDPDNLLLWRMRLRRIESEVVRDTLLAVSGQLDLRPGGPPDGHQARPDGLVQVASRRRSLYVLGRRNYHPTLLGVFDQPILSTLCTARNSSAVVTQSLAMLNDAFVLEQANQLAQRVARDAGTEANRRVERAFWIVLSRAPSTSEQAQCVAFLRRQAERFRTDKQPPVQAEQQALAQLCHMLLNTNEFLYMD